MKLKLRKIRAGLYETLDGRYQIENDAYEPVRPIEQEYRITVGSDARLTGGHVHDNVYYAPEEPCWIILSGEQNLGMYDTLRDAREALARILAKE